MKTAVRGFSTKTITIPTVAGVYTYNLGDYQDDNFGKNAKIIGMSSRSSFLGSTFRSRTDRPLLTSFDSQRAYINLMSNTLARENVIFQSNLYTLNREYSHVHNSYDLFLEPGLINWDESQIQFQPSLVINGSLDIELNVYYITDCPSKVETNIIFDNNFEYLGLFKFNVEIPNQVGNALYQINNGRNPLPPDAVLVGMRINDYDLKTLNDNTGVYLGNYLGAAFLNMKVGNRLMLENFPLSDLEPFDRLGYSYFPVEPTFAKDFDWSNCEIYLSDKSHALANHAFLITFFYIRKRN